MAETAGAGALVDRVRALEPVVRAHDAWQEENRRMAPEVNEAISAAGLWSIWKPRAFGGMECEPVVALQAFEAMARIDGAVGWALANQTSIDTFGPVLREEGAKDVYGDPGRPVAGAWSPPGQAVPTDGGYRVTGRWPFASTCTYAQYFTGMTMIVEDGQPRVGPDGAPVMLVVFFPPEDAEIIDTWHTLGMRGTGSHDVTVNDIFVPERRAWIMAPLAGERSGAYAGALYTAFPWAAIAALGAVGIGIGQAAIDELIDTATAKTPNYTATTLCDREVAQSTVARAQATIDAARAYLHDRMASVYASGLEGQKATVEEGVRVQLATCNALEAASKTVRMVHDTVGTSGIRNEFRFQRVYRDGVTIAQHAFGNLSRYESCGKVLFGLQSDWGFFYL
jgi:alkylation response protein AidB-like acyl-CoA dehydrogenase